MKCKECKYYAGYRVDEENFTFYIKCKYKRDDK